MQYPITASMNSMNSKLRSSDEELFVHPVRGQLIPPPTPDTHNVPVIASRRHRINWRLINPRPPIVTRSVSKI